ncbi:hypothetical protein CIB95_09015 [Lottiidibacillus patelloidae]|uniref:histidine kinase n=1 Tax=Lottiidibacillus patelloidae TaxID=2670334 RepID=A0A263BT52_9BACI|nr:ATP-binding protein [Lottiidibacillus patelloidae]OZM56900.1 hypothetical protein CIB95_09015 [Lottiidibacillus patelloidae]
MITEKSNLDYKQFVPRESGFVFKFIKKGEQYIHTFIEGKLIEKVGLTPSMVVGKTLYEFLPIEQASKKKHFYERAWSGESVNYEGYFDGHYYIASLNPVTKNSKVVEVIGIALDITKEKEREIHLQNIERLAVVGELAAGIAHEIRNPLTSIKGFTKIVKESVDSENLKSYLDITLREIDRINTIVSEFMFISKPQEFMNLQLTNLNRVLSNCIAFMEPQANLKSIRITSYFHSEIQTKCDENQLKQVLINILQNAIEATHDSDQDIEVILKETENNKVLIQISDSGVGITEERTKKLFQPFYSTKEKGTGLGLIICKRIIELHQGTIEIKSKSNEGTVVKILLPIDIPCQVDL